MNQAINMTSVAWPQEKERINRRFLEPTALAAIVTYCGGTSLGTWLEYDVSQELFWELMWRNWLPAPLIIVAWLMVRYAKANSLILGYTIFFSLTVSGALVVGYASMYNDSWLFLTETQIAIYITFALLTVWHWKHAAICFVGSVLLCGSIFVFHSPTLWVAWVQKWLIITPVGVGMVIIIWMRYRGIYENFHITQALKASTADLAA
ncbi:hypothetical protein [Eisenibacter elegans]|uniref:hypothetical protein n=1 Tax=Eisenibacter elegans TaxID=997 RepID=UPI0003FABC47|nr:hypothetical protein [Eisenibacter elegans]